jgi:hypothetical protein
VLPFKCAANGGINRKMRLLLRVFLDFETQISGASVFLIYLTGGPERSKPRTEHSRAPMQLELLAVPNGEKKGF